MKLNDVLKELHARFALSKERKEQILARLLREIAVSSMLREGEQTRRIPQRSLREILLIRMPIVALIVLLALAGGGTSFAAQSALPGDTLYPVKVSINEPVEGAFAVSPQAKASFDARIAEVRLQEAQVLVAQHKLTPVLAAQIDANFQTHANGVETHIKDIEAQDVHAAADTASQFEATLKAHRAILAGLGQDVSGTIALDSETRDIVRVRHDLEVKIESEDSHSSDSAQASQGSIGAAQNVISEVKQFIDQKSQGVSTTTIARAEAQLATANDLMVQAQAKLTAGDQSGAFVLAHEAIRAAQEAKIVLNADSELDGDFHLNASSTFDREGDNEDASSTEIEDGGHGGRNATSSNATRGGKDGGENRGGERNGTATSGVNVDLNEDGGVDVHL